MQTLFASGATAVLFILLPVALVTNGNIVVLEAWVKVPSVAKVTVISSVLCATARYLVISW